MLNYWHGFIFSLMSKVLISFFFDVDRGTTLCCADYLKCVKTTNLIIHVDRIIRDSSIACLGNARNAKQSPIVDLMPTWFR